MTRKKLKEKINQNKIQKKNYTYSNKKNKDWIWYKKINDRIPILWQGENKKKRGKQKQFIGAQLKLCCTHMSHHCVEDVDTLSMLPLKAA